MDSESSTISPGRPGPNISLYILCISVSSIIVYGISARFDILEHLVAFSHKHENLEIDEIAVVCMFLLMAFAYVSIRQTQYLRLARNELILKNEQLVTASTEIKQLRGIIPICASCKKIRDDIGLWHQAEAYLSEHSGALFSHSLCPDCFKKLYPDFTNEAEEQGGSS